MKSHLKLLWLQHTVAVSMIFVFSMLVMSEVLSGLLPSTFDHYIHLAHTYTLKESILSGKLWSWMEDWGAGYPSGVTYHIGNHLFVILIDAFSGFSLSVEHAYRLTIFLTFFLFGLSLYIFTYKSLGITTGLLAAFFVMTNMGYRSETGWIYNYILGVWSAPLSTSFCLLAFFFTIHFRKKYLIPASICFAAAILCHPLQLIHFSLFFLAYILSQYFFIKRTERTLVIKKAISVFMLGILLSSFWLVPFIAYSEYTVKLGQPWMYADKIIQRLSTGNLFPFFWFYPSLFALLGLVVLFRKKNPLSVTIASLPIVVIILCSRDLFELLKTMHLDIIVERIRLPRVIGLTEPYLAIAGAYFFTTLIEISIPQNKKDSSSSYQKKNILRFALAMILASMPAYLFYTDTVRNYGLSLREGNLEEYEQAISIIKKHSETDDAFFRIMFTASLVDGTSHFSKNVRLSEIFGDAHCVLGLTIAEPFGIYKFGPFPASHFTSFPSNVGTYTVRHLGIRYVIHSHEKLPKKFLFMEPHLQKIGETEKLSIYRYKQWRSERYDILHGDARITMHRFNSEEISFDVHAREESTLLLHTSNFPMWRVLKDGIPYTPQIYRKFKMKLLKIPLEKGEHHYQLLFQYGPIEYMGLGLSCLGIFLAIYIGLRRNRSESKE